MSKPRPNCKLKAVQQHIKKEDNFKILHRDKQALKAGYICGHVKEEQLLTIISPNRLKTYKQQGLYKEVKSQKGEVYLKFTKAGRDFVADRFGWDHAYVAKSLTHDAIISDKFFSLSVAERESAKSETEVKNELIEKAFFVNEDSQKTNDYIKFLEEQTSPVDFVYDQINEVTGEVETVGFEAVTINYTAEERQMKHNFAHCYGCKLEMRRS